MFNLEKTFQLRQTDLLRKQSDRLSNLEVQIGLLTEMLSQPSVASQSQKHIDIAEGKPFTLSSARSGFSLSGIINAQTPIFFHTATERAPSITIDLCSTHQIFGIELENRTDTALDRAKPLFLRLGLEFPEDGYLCPLIMSKEFFAHPPQPSYIAFESHRARYVTLSAGRFTALHLSRISVYGQAINK